MTTVAEEQADWGTILSSFDFFDDGEKLSYAKKFNDEGYDVEMMKLMSFKDFVEQFHMPMKKALKLAVFLKKRDRVEESPPSAAAVSASSSSSSSSSPASSASSAEKALSDLGIDNTAREAARQAVEMFQQQQQQQQARPPAKDFGMTLKGKRPKDSPFNVISTSTWTMMKEPRPCDTTTSKHTEAAFLQTSLSLIVLVKLLWRP
ncbi:expressed unknown protein [Seminavis robusta]|uniref:Uncharacterized protein n=1 Tax=Seminavis robusta TaxID=568900 RepID=A0A9N8HIU1_9STRA|nr:expressed unknown protein [Seminavis robusta]|eukprot:Sro519_g159000.1 n/a (205) ;mRNA; f:35335-35949